MSVMKPPERTAVFTPRRFSARMSSLAPLVGVMTDRSLVKMLASTPLRRATRSRREAAKSSSPFIARAVIAETWGSTPIEAAMRSITSCSIRVESMSKTTRRG